MLTRWIFIFALVLPEVCIPPTASCQVSPPPPIGGPALDSSRFHFRVSGAPGSTHIVEASGDLLTWSPVITNSIPATGYFDVGDSLADQSPKQFYRTVYVPGAASTDNLLEGFRQDTILVKPKSGIALGTLDGLHQSLGVQILRTYPSVGNLLVLRVPSTSSISDLVANYQRSDLVEYAEPDFHLQALQEPNDFRFTDGSLWNLHNIGQGGGVSDADIDAPEGWDIQNRADNIIVAVIDTGVRYTHEDLAGNMWVNSGEIAGNNLDDDGNGYVDDVHGIDAINNTGDPNDVHGHGTHVSGIIGAVGNNGVGVAGVCWHVQIMACRFLDPVGQGFISDAIECIDYARSKGAKVINASWGSTTFTSATLRDAINAARQAGIIFVAAAGNSADNNDVHPLYPASYDLDNIISVAATTRTDDLAFFSHFGATSVDLGAPGAAIFSCWNGSDSDYRYFDGTSMAAPHVTGACALLRARYPNESYQQIINRILSNVDPLPGLAGKSVSGGRLNLHKALGGSSPPPPPPRPTVTVTATDGNASEQGPEPGTFTITRTGSTTSALTVNYTLGGAAGNGTDYQQPGSSVTIPAGSGSATVTVTPIDDSAVEGAETVVLTLSSDAAYNVGSPNSTTVTIADNDQGPPLPDEPVITLTAVDPDALETGPDTGIIRFHRTGDTSQAIQVSWTFSGTAANGSDFQQLPTTSEFPAGLSDADLTITPIDDSAVEGNETVTVTLVGGAGYSVGSSASATVTIADNDQPPPPPKPTVTVAASDANAAEPGNTGAFTVSRSGDTSAALTVRYSFNGTAQNGTDYQQPGTSVTIGAGSSSAIVTVTPIDDSVVEGSETVVMTLSSDAAYDIGSANSATVTIADNDQPPPPPRPTVTVAASDANAAEGGNTGAFAISRTGSTASALAVKYTLTGTASSGSDYQPLGSSVTIPAGSSSATITMTPTDDSAVENAETVVITLASDAAYNVGSPNSATITIADNDQLLGTRPTATVVASQPTASESGNPGIFTIRLSGPVSSDVTVRYSFGGHGVNGTDYQTLTDSVTVPAGATSVDVRVIPIDDSDIEIDELVYLMLYGWTGAPYIVGSPDSATVTIIDNDDFPVRPTVTVVASDGTAAESGDAGTFSIRLSQPAPSDLTVRYSFGGNARNGTDFQTLSESVTIPAGASSADVRVIPIDDSDIEIDEPVYLMLYGWTGAPYIVGKPDSATVTIVDND